MKTFIAFIIKESRHILRDRRTMLILFGMPVVMMLLFGFAISTDVRNVRTVIVTATMDRFTQRVADELGAAEYFNIVATAGTAAQAEQMIRNQHADMAIVFRNGFADNRFRGGSGVQIIVDAADPNMAQQYANYARMIVMQAMGGGSAAASVSTKMLYNPQMKSAYNFVPGIMGMLLMLICAMMTSISIVREKERGTMEVLLVSPVRPFMIVVAKTVPYLLLAIVVLISILLLSFFVLGVPLEGSLFYIFLVSFIYIMLALSLGLLISSIASTQLVALLMSAMGLLLPIILLSGMVFPIESMPEILRYVSLIIPARWYISALRKLMIMGVGVNELWNELCVLTGMAVILLTVSVVKFKKRLE
ncbi:ABC transporter permease [Hoylesella oralis]|uniref:ABC transporter permease n=1 Tax=Hoylesella oralis TaxID=28134 RepID=UPI0028F09AB4|nr:ABC transporter permease [Hoylesella oralis]